MKKLYFRELGKWVELEDEVADALDDDRARVRMTEQNNGRCRIAKNKTYLCDGNCLDCIYHHEGRKVVKKNACENCPYGVPKARRGYSKECRDCENYEFLTNVSLFDNEDVSRHRESALGTAPSPEEIFLEQEAIDEYKRMAKGVEGGDKLIDQLSDGDSVTEIVKNTGRPQATVSKRKNKIKEALEAHGISKNKG